MNVLLKTKELQSYIIRKLSCDNMITPVQGHIIEYLNNNEHIL